MSESSTITISFPRAWLHIAADLLSKASDEFGGHGCNDYALPKWMTPEQRADLDRAYHVVNGDPEEDPSDGPIAFDFCLMHLFAAKLREMAGPVPELTAAQAEAAEREAAERAAKAAADSAAYMARLAREAQERADKAKKTADEMIVRLRTTRR